MKTFLQSKTRITILFIAISAISTYVFAQPGAVTKTFGVNVAQAGNPATVAWTNVTDATNENGNTALVSLSVGNIKRSKSISITNFGFVLGSNAGEIPTNANISGIVVEIKKKVTGTVRDQSIQLLKNGNTAGGTRNLPGNWPTSLSYTTHGNVTDLWGTTWSPAQISSANFGVEVQVMNSSNSISIAEIDNIKITIYYNLNIFYSKSTGNLTDVATWGTNPNGSGASPINFSTAGQIFNLVNRSATTLNADLTISGLYSKMIVGNGTSGTNLTVPTTAVLIAVTDVADASSLTLQNTTLPVLGALDINSTVNYNAAGTQNVSEANYGHLSITGTGVKQLQAGTLGMSTVSGNLAIFSTSTFTVNKPIYVYGNINNAGTANGTDLITLTGNSTSALNGGGSYRALSVDKTVDNGYGATLSGTVIIDELLLCQDDSISNSSFLIPQNGSTIQVEDGVIMNNISSGNSYNVLYTGNTKTGAEELSGSGLNDVTINLATSSNIFTASGFNLSGNLLIASGNFTPATATYSIGKDFINNANFTAGTSTISFTGAMNSNISGTTVTDFYNLMINKSTALYTLSINKNITIANQLTLTGGVFNLGVYTLTQAGPMVRTAGMIDGATGTLNMSGAVAQVIPAGCFVSNALASLVINNTGTGVTLGGALDIYKNVSFGNVNNKVLASGGFLSVKSTATYTATVSDLTNNGLNTGNSVTGNVMVERYIPAGRKWRFLSIATSGTQSFKETWMENNAAGANNTPGYGMMISNNTASWSTDGFDAYSVGGPTVKYYNAANNTWAGITSVSSSISNSIGYMTFVRGSRAYATTNATTSSTVLRTTGSLKQGSQAAINITTNTTASIGNPYASAVDLRKLSKTGVQDFFYVWDPKLSGTYGVGGYQTFSKSGANYVITPGGGSYGSIGSTQNYIESGQAFFVKGAAGGSLTFHENAKASVSNNVFFVDNNVTPASFRANLLIPSGDTTLMADGVLVDYDEIFSNAVDWDDAPKITNSNENVSIKRDGVLLMIERRFTMSSVDTLSINISGMRTQSYRWRFTSTDLNIVGRVAFIKDNFLNITTPISLDGITNLDFNVNGNAASYASNRFMIIFEQAAVLPVTITTVSASRKQDQTIQVQWHVENEVDIQSYEVERSIDGKHFENIEKSNATSSASGNYTFTDTNPATTDNYYRIKANSINGMVQYSSIVKVKAIASADVQVYTTTAPGNMMNVYLNNLAPANYTIRVIATSGQIVSQENIKINAAQFVKSIDMNTATAGIYTISIISENGFKQSLKAIVY